MEIIPEGTTFDPPAGIVLAWDDVDNNGVVDNTSIQEKNLRISKDGVAITNQCKQHLAQVLPYDPICDPEANTFTVYVTSLSVFVLMTHKPDVQVDPVGPVDEGAVFNGTGSFNDPDGDVWTATVDYGDGSGSQPLALNVDKSFVLSHTYADDGTYTVTVTVNDEDGGIGTAQLSMTVINVNPAVVVSPDQAIDEGGSVSISGSFTDPGADTHTIAWDFGDGSPLGETLTPTHTYPDNGIYTVTLSVADDDGGVGTASLVITVNNVAPTVGPITSQS